MKFIGKNNKGSLKNNNYGKSYFFSIIIFLCLILIFSLTYEYLRLEIISKGIRDAIKKETAHIASDNFYDIYGDIRDIDWENEINNNDNFVSLELIEANLMDYLSKNLELKKSGDEYLRVLKSNKTEFSLSNPDVKVNQISKNDELNKNKEVQKTRYIIYTKVKVKIYLEGVFEKIPPIEKTVAVETGISTTY